MIGLGVGLFVINLRMLVPIYDSFSTKKQLNSPLLLIGLGLMLTNIIGAFIFWLYEWKTSRFHLSKYNQSFIESELIFIGLVFIYELLAIFLTISDPSETVIIIALLVILLMLLIQHYAKNVTKRSHLMGSLLTVLAIIVVNQWAATNEYKISIIVVTLAVLHEYPLEISKRFAFVPLILYVGFSSVAMDMSAGANYRAIFMYAIRNAITYGLVLIMFYIGKKQLVLVDELKRTAMELREKNQRMEEVQLMRERNRIAREIHDTLGHTLTGAIIQLEAAKKMVAVDQKQAIAMIERTQGTTREGFADVKRAIQALRPIMIEESNLDEALNGLAERVQTDCGVVVNLELGELLVLDEARKIALYRMAQEGITNSLRHGEASNIRIDIRQKQNLIRFVMEDNGVGCANFVEGYGLKGIRERVAQFDGQMTIKSTSGNGFMMMICIPQLI